MAHSYLSYRQADLLLHDIEIILVAHIAAHVLKTDVDAPRTTRPVRAMVEEWATLLDVYMPGALDLELDKHVTTMADQRSLISLLEHCRNLVLSKGPTIEKKYFDAAIGEQDSFDFPDRKSDDIAKMFTKFIEFLDRR